jgi:hypothetical protein
MAVYDGAQTITVIAGDAVPIYRFVQLQTDGKFDPVGVAQARADGLSAGAAAADTDDFPMVIPNGARVKVEAGASVTVGAQVASDNAGKAIAHVDTAGNYILGVALTAGGAGDIIEILFSVHQDGA